MKDLVLAERQEKLWQWVKEQHGEQKRKYTGDPYYTHLWNVAQLVNNVVPDLVFGIEVALCHDLFEDTKCTASDLYNKLYSIGYGFSEMVEIVESVYDLSD